MKPYSNIKWGALLLAICYCNAVWAQNIGIGHQTAEAKLDINGDLILRSAVLILADGNNTAVDVGSNPFSNFRISGPTAAFTISGISFSPDGKVLTLFNRSGFTMTVANESATAETSERIITGTGGALTIPNNASINLQYDGAAQRWVVRSQSGTASGGGNNSWLSNGNSSIYNNNSGNVGIGTMYPFYKLSVQGDGFVGTNYGLNFLPGQQGGYFFQGGSFTVASHNLENFPVGIEANHVLMDGQQLQAYVRRLDDGTVSDYARSFVLNPFGGNIGIGTNYNPIYAKLEIKINSNERGWTVGTNTYNLQSFLGGAGRSPNSEGCYIGTAGTVATNVPAPLHFFTNSQWAQMTLLPNGNVGIGTTAPDSKLSVNGNIRARELVIENQNWADYVFETGYPLMAIDTLKKHVQQFKHLPGIPTATHIAAKGLSVSAVQSKMMEKIEELSLYIIQLHERITQLEKQPQ